jgi:hypothetical protein
MSELVSSEVTCNIDAPKELLKILSRIYHKRMSVVMIKGVPQSGKTDFALLIAETLRKMSLIQEFATNASVLNCSWMKKIEAMNILKAWGYSTKHSKLFIYDEVIESATNRRAMSDLPVAWVQNLPQISHQDIHILALVQEEKGGKRFYESAFQDPAFLRGIWYKEQRDKAVFKSQFYDDWKDGYELSGIPKTTIEFDKHTHAIFQLTGSDTNNFNAQPLQIQIASLYVQFRSYKKIREQLNMTKEALPDMTIQRAIVNVLKGSLQGNAPVIEEEKEASVEVKVDA